MHDMYFPLPMGAGSIYTILGLQSQWSITHTPYCRIGLHTERDSLKIKLEVFTWPNTGCDTLLKDYSGPYTHLITPLQILSFKIQCRTTLIVRFYKQGLDVQKAVDLQMKTGNETAKDSLGSIQTLKYVEIYIHSSSRRSLAEYRARVRVGGGKN